jgi:hypothetical protein
VRGCSDQAAHYHNLGPKLGASLLTRHIGWKQKEEKEEEEVETGFISGLLAENYRIIFCDI